MKTPPPVRLQQIRIEVPRREWAPVSTGHKAEFRVPGRRATTKFPAPCPTPALIYVTGIYETHQRLIVLEDTWTERLGEISEESILREGASSLAEFRHLWCARANTRFRPLDPVRVYRVRLFTPDDADAMGRVLLDRLYGEHL